MSTYYKYAEQNADSQVNWADVSKNVSDMLKAEVEIREKKKTAYDEAFQKMNQEIANSPQGKWQDGNRFTNDAAHDIMQQSLINYRLFKSGQMNERDYTLARQNLQNGTNTLFDLQKSYQSVYDDRMQGLLSGKYQALTGSEMQQVEGFKDFSTSKAIIDPYTGMVNVGKMVKNPTTGVMELTKDVVPVNVLFPAPKPIIVLSSASVTLNSMVSVLPKNCTDEPEFNAA